MTDVMFALLFFAVIAMAVLGILGLRATTTGTATAFHALAHGGALVFAFLFVWLGVDVFKDFFEEHEIKLPWVTELAISMSLKLVSRMHIVGPILVFVFVTDLIIFRIAQHYLQTRSRARAFSAIVTGLFAVFFVVLFVALLVPFLTNAAVGAAL